MSPAQVAFAAAKIEWKDIEAQARMIASYASSQISDLESRVNQLEAALKTIKGIADSQ